jgi:AhpC/TSA family
MGHLAVTAAEIWSHVRQWYQQYTDRGFVVIGVLSPEFSHKREAENVQRYMKEHDIRFPVPIDNDFSTWNAYANRYWPAMYLSDKRSTIRYVKVCEGEYSETEQQILTLLERVIAVSAFVLDATVSRLISDLMMEWCPKGDFQRLSRAPEGTRFFTAL